MKKSILLLASFLLMMPLLTFGQKKGATQVNQREELMSLGSRPSFSLRFPNTDKKRVESAWKSFAKDQFGKKVKRNKKTNEYTSMEASASPISSDDFDVYAIVEESGDDVTLKVWFDLGVNFLNQKDNPSAAEEVEAYLRAFDNEVEKTKAADRIKAEEKTLKGYEGDLKKLQKKNDGYHKDIKDAEEKIRKAKDRIKQNEKDQESKKSEIDAQQKALEIAQRYLDGLG